MKRLKSHAQLTLAVAVAAGLPLVIQSGSLATEVLIYALAVLGCNLLLGFTGLLSFGQGIFFGLGSYTAGLLLTRWPLPMPLALLAAVAMGALAATAVVASRTDAIGVGLAIARASLVLAAVPLAIARRRRVREERAAR